MTIELKEVIFFIILITLVYLPYKRRTFEDVSWMRCIVQSMLFVVGSVALIVPNNQDIFIVYAPVTVSLFLLTTILWFKTPWFVRKFGVRPSEHIRNNPFQFVVRFEYRVMVMKYFEIIFQQAQLLYIFFILFSFVLYVPYKLLLFLGFVVVAHFINIYLMPDRKAALFWLKASVPMGILFGPLLLFGYVLITTSIHTLAYLFFVSYWIPSAKKWRLL